MKVIKDTIYRINGRYFSIYELENSGSTVKREVLATTTINGNTIKFSCELIKQKDDSAARDFFANSVNLINSIVIDSIK
jgi:hypothetical protein